MDDPCVAVVSQSSDPFSITLVSQLTAQLIPVIQITPGNLGDLRIHLEKETFFINNNLVGAIFFNARPDENLCLSYQENDRPFVNAEIRAAWLAAMQLDTIMVINRYDADTWFENLNWPSWRRRLASADIPLSEIHYGGTDEPGIDFWLPYTFYTSQEPLHIDARKLLGAASVRELRWQWHRFVCGEAVTISPPPCAQAAADALLLYGISLVEIGIDTQEKVVVVNPIPLITNPIEIATISERLVRLIYAHLHTR